MMIKRTDYTVEGEGEFPHDMLRFEEAWPRDDAAAKAIAIRYCHADDAIHRRRRINLSTMNGFRPSARRWESFGWKVVSVSSDGMIHQEPAIQSEPRLDPGFASATDTLLNAIGMLTESCMETADRLRVDPYLAREKVRDVLKMSSELFDATN